ncbi:sensor histidine kinase [Weissella paramesenteroides]|uniref:sensor histidine kinase n=1 Tax=Weissella paramesenteroides TaxID=1249 RepID=UPI00388EDDED
MKKSFFKGGVVITLLMSIPLVTFALLFYLFNLDWLIYRAGFFFVLLTYFIIMIYLFLHVRHTEDLQKQVRSLQEQLQNLKNSSMQKEQDQEDYFLMWVHQMKSPISASDLLLTQMPKTEATLHLHEEILKIDHYTNMVLNYMKVTNPETDMLFDHISINQLVQPLLRKYRLEFIQYHIKLHYESTTNTVLTEANLSSLMIEQLLTNAIKYAHNREIWIIYHVETNQLIIKDSGMGIQPSDLPRIFDKGYTGLNGQLNEKSSGIGLFLVKKISERLSQPIEVSSVINEGTCFTITFH